MAQATHTQSPCIQYRSNNVINSIPLLFSSLQIALFKEELAHAFWTARASRICRNYLSVSIFWGTINVQTIDVCEFWSRFSSSCRFQLCVCIAGYRLRRQCVLLIEFAVTNGKRQSVVSAPSNTHTFAVKNLLNVLISNKRFVALPKKNVQNVLSSTGRLLFGFKE